jgi:AcrR family transcriptional regulator
MAVGGGDDPVDDLGWGRVQRVHGCLDSGCLDPDQLQCSVTNMEMMRLTTSEVKSRRRYDASRRREAATARREAVLDAAARRFATDGYAATTVAAVAADAGVSPETVYKSFGGKPGLVRALWERALAGTGTVHAEKRSDAVSSTSDDPYEIIATWARLSTEVAPVGTPVALLLREAAASDPAAAELYAELEAARLRRMAHNARAIRRHLRPGLTLARARDVMFALTAPGLYETLVMHQGWPVEAYGEFVRRTLVAQLLDD